MPTIEIESSERIAINHVIAIVRDCAGELTNEGKQVLALELLRMFKPQIDELKRNG